MFVFVVLNVNSVISQAVVVAHLAINYEYSPLGKC